MKDASRLTATLGSLPGWERAEWRRLPGGLTNCSFLLESEGRRAVLKIDEQPRSAPYNEREQERRIQELAADRELAGRVIHASDTVYLTEYLDGRVWEAGDLINDDKLAQLAAALKRLHAMPLSGRKFDATLAAETYLANVRAADMEMAVRCMDTIRRTPAPDKLCCCHNDLVVENIISCDGVRFLDWEYACDNDPCFDLATIIAHHKLGQGQASRLLDAYFDGDGQRWRGRLDAQMRQYQALSWLWQASRP